MTILQIAALAAAAVLIGRLPRGRQMSMLAVSTLAVFWLQPVQPLGALAFWIPVATLGITAFAWALTATSDMQGWRQTWPPALLMIGLALMIDFARSTAAAGGVTAIALHLGRDAMILALLSAAIAACSTWRSGRGVLMIALLLSILVVFVVVKTAVLAASATQAISGLQGRAASTEPGAAVQPLAILGYSYVAFRLIHTIRDRQAGRLPAVTLGEYMNYVIFFPAFTAGPIDRVERFVKDLKEPLSLQPSDWMQAGTRLLLGLFKKFVVADLLGVISIRDVLVSHVQAAGWLWLFTYAYALRIYLDFSGYTDVAIALGRLLGIRLPENFASPYLKPNLAQFWNSWHMTLTQWFRSYVFNPLTRWLRSGSRAAPAWLTILVGQISTMVLIGLWHGIAWSFAVWGLWHAVGLFLHNRWLELTRNRVPGWTRSGHGQRLANAAGVFVTFNFVAVGWLFFELSSPALAWHTLLKMLGAA